MPSRIRTMHSSNPLYSHIQITHEQNTAYICTVFFHQFPYSFPSTSAQHLFSCQIWFFESLCSHWVIPLDWGKGGNVYMPRTYRQNILSNNNSSFCHEFITNGASLRASASFGANIITRYKSVNSNIYQIMSITLCDFIVIYRHVPLWS